MLKRLDTLFWLLVIILLSRLITMMIIPMMETTEPRYAEIARIMASTGDWITPWFSDGIPFWGKPPLSFWMEAVSFRLLGVTEFAARLPSWLAHLATTALIYILTRTLTDHRQALLSAIIFSSMALVYIMSGTVLTDPFLTLGTTLSMVSFLLSLKQQNSPWRWWFFIGLSIGLLAKGPLALILTGAPIFVWILWQRQWRETQQALPWRAGILLTALLSLPWYIAAELKTPGFIQYFIIGEHFLRFVDAGWNGDLYGTSHKQAYGTIWLYWLQASFPWGPLALFLLVKHRLKQPIYLNKEQALLVSMAIFPSLFFTLAGNILATYQLPALAPLAILLTYVIPARRLKLPSKQYGLITLSLLIPITVTLTGITIQYYPEKIKSEKNIVNYYKSIGNDRLSPLIYLDKLPFSARFYSAGKAVKRSLPEIVTLLDSKQYATLLLTVPVEDSNKLISSLDGNITRLISSKEYTMLKIVPVETKIANKKRN